MIEENDYVELSILKRFTNKVSNLLNLFFSKFNLVMVIFSIVLNSVILFVLFYMGNILFTVFMLNIFYIVKYYYNLKKHKRESAIY